jgi:hypothetical protein
MQDRLTLSLLRTKLQIMNEAIFPFQVQNRQSACDTSAGFSKMQSVEEHNPLRKLLPSAYTTAVVFTSSNSAPSTQRYHPIWPVVLMLDVEGIYNTILAM